MNAHWLPRSAVVLAACIALPSAASAQAAWTPGSEVVGQPIQVTTNGITDTVTLSPGGQVGITSPGGRLVNGSWTAANGQLCLTTGGPQECWPYSAPFQPGQAVTLTSSCNAASTWLAEATNQPPPPPAQRGERGF